MFDAPLTEVERFPLLTERSRAMLRRLQQHANAPRWTYQCGDRLDAAGLAAVKAFAERQRTEPRGWNHGETPVWVADFIDRCRYDVPFYRNRLSRGQLLTCSRDDLRREPWSFVPDSADASELIVYRTSGTSGNLIHIPAHPVAPARYLPLFQSALAAHGVSLLGGDRVSLIQVAAQVQTYTFASVSSFLDGAGVAKINLNPADWSHPEDRERFFDDCAPEIVTGDPLALEQLAALPIKSRPGGILSSATLLLPALRDRLIRRFGCPVIDVYSMNETGPIAFARSGSATDEHEILPHNLYVEILDDTGQPVEPGERGEIVVTGGVNPFLPLVRYRTGDFGALTHHDGVPRLAGIERRRPIVFQTTDGIPIASISVTVALFQVPLPFFSLSQRQDGTLTFRTRCDAAVENDVRNALRSLFGSTPLSIEQLPWEVAWQGKSIQYSSDAEDAMSVSFERQAGNAGMETTAWHDCRFLTCSVLPVRLACNCTCPFCFSKSSISSLRHDPVDWGQVDLERYFTFARERGASRLVITGGGEPLLRADAVLDAVRRGKAFFDEIACFTNGSLMTCDLARKLANAGLSYLCFSRHHFDDLENGALMGRAAPPLRQFFETAQGLIVRATCVMTRGNIDNEQMVWRYVERLAEFGVRQFTFKHTYVAYERSVFAASAADRWAEEHRVDCDPFADRGEIIGKLSWGPAIRRIGEFQVCYYHEPTPAWELEHQICRSVNLLSDGTVFASLEDQSSRLFRLRNSWPL